MQFSVLGTLEIRSGNEILPIRRGRPRLLLHLLLLNRRVSLGSDLIVDRLWGEAAPADAANAVHQLVSYLRHAIGADGRDLIVTTPTGYQLNATDDHVDSWKFERLVHMAISEVSSNGSGNDVLQGLDHIRDALKMWRGEPFAESAGYEWSAGDRARLQNTYLQALESRLEAMLLLGRHQEVVLESQSLAAAYPLREQFHALLSLAQYRSGRQGEALEVHRNMRRLLADELGIDPGPGLQELEQRILRQDPGLDWAPSQDRLEPERPAEPAPSSEALASTGSSAEPESGRAPKVVPLPSWPTRIVGREADVEALQRLVLSQQVVTVTGPAGVGKSRLAVEVAYELDPFPAWFVDLSDIDEDQVAPTVTDRLGLVDQTRKTPHERLGDAFSSAEGLLVLDTCEQVVSGVSEMVTRLTQAAPGLRILATSRRPLGVLGEALHQLLPLAPPAPVVTEPDVLAQSPAVQLFEDRARLVRGDFRLDEGNMVDVADVVRVLDGMPIAIELAAAHADVLSAAQIRLRIAGHLDALVSDNVAVPPRQRSLRAAIESSVVRATDDERDFFIGLAIFPGPFDIEAAAAVSGVAPDAAYAFIASLVRQSMVSTDGADRYRLLGPIRAYANSLLTGQPQYADIRRRHVDWVCAFAETRDEVSPGAQRREELNTLRGLLPDARVALQSAIAERYVVGATKVAVAFSWVWTLHGMAAEGIDWLESVRRLTDSAGDLDPEEKEMKAALLRSLGLLANPIGRLELARDVCTEAAALSADVGDQVGEAAALLTMGIAQWALGDLDAAAASHDRAAVVMSPYPESWHYLAALVLRARTAMDRGEPGFERLIDHAVEKLQPANEQQMLGLAISFQARHLLRSGNFATAAVTAEEALRVWRSIDYAEGEMSASNILARALVGLCDHARAEEFCSAALAAARSSAHRGALIETVESLALVAAAQGRREHALLLFSACAREREKREIPLLGQDQVHLSALQQELTSALTTAVPLISARVKLLRFDDLVDQLLTGR